MIRLTWAACFGALALAGPAAAQPPQNPLAGAMSDASAPAPQTDPRPVDATNAVSLKAGDIPVPLGSVAPNVQPDVTVRGHPLREPCKPRDQGCIHAVTAEIWRRYPEQIKQICLREETYRFEEGFLMQDLGIAGANVGRLSPQTQALCNYGAQLKRRQQRAAAEAAAVAAPAPPTTP